MRRLTARQLRWRLSAQLSRWRATRRLLGAARYVLFGALDLRDRALGRQRRWSVPPRRLIFVGGLEFEAVGHDFLRLLRERGGLTPESDVLDVGCGVGRIAVPLASYLGPGARYEGFDVVPDGVAWCQAEITARRPNFRFQALDVFNPRYNPAGEIAADELRFPYDDGSFDVVFATSVFTHMPAAEVERYLAESARVLRAGGRLFATWYLLDAERPRGSGPQADERAWFPRRQGSSAVVSRHVPEAAIGHQERWVLSAHQRAGLEPPAVAYGSWLGAEGPSWQDLVVARKS